MKNLEKNYRLLNTVITSLLASAGFLAVLLWFGAKPETEIELRKPVYHAGRETGAGTRVEIGSFFRSFSGVPSLTGGNWGSFRGEARDNVSRENIPLTGTLDETDLPVLWDVRLGEGYAGPAVRNGLVYILDYDSEERRDILRAFSLDDGSEVWRRGYDIAIKRNHGYSRTVPAVTERHAVTIGPKGHVMCVDALSGEFIWGIDLEAEYGSEIPPWYAGQCPLIDGDTAVIAPGGRALLIGVDLDTGEVLWETPNPGSFSMSHSSVIPMTFHGKKMYVYCAVGGMTGVSAEGKDRGRILWQIREWTQAVIAPSPVELPDNRIFVTAGYGAGGAVFEIKEEEGVFGARITERFDRSVIAAEQHTPVFYNGSLYSVLPYDAGELNRQLVRVSTDGRLIWSSGRTQRFGLGPFIIADGKIYVLDNDGYLTVAEAGADGYRKLSRARVLRGKESWGPIAVTEGRMLLRDYETLICLDLRETSDEE